MRTIFRLIRTWIASLIIAVFIVFLLRTFIGTTTNVRGTSMCPAFYPGDKIIVSTLSSTFNKIPERGDCITFESPSIEPNNKIDVSNPVAKYEEDKSFIESIMHNVLGLTKSSYIKRVIGLPGEHIEIKNNKVYINGKVLKEEYIPSLITTDTQKGEQYYDVVVPDNCVYVLGDNRTQSSDSRRYGCIPVDKIEGKVWFRWWKGKIK